jgi:NAD-dependent SIR2 family protein deacetylase
MVATVLFLGAGATKACGGPLTGEILPSILKSKNDPPPSPSSDSSARLDPLVEFLTGQFHVTAASPDDHYPALPLLMSLIDMALNRRQGFHSQWELPRVSDLREAIELGIFDHLEKRLEKAPTNNHWELFQMLYEEPEEPSVISTNYDVIADTAMMFVGDGRLPEGCFPDYRCQISSDFYRDEPRHFGTLLKLHGSLNWLYCRSCHRLEIRTSESRLHLKVMQRVLGPSLEQAYSTTGNPCPACQTKLLPLLIAPTHLKDYRNPHIAQVWYEAESLLRSAERVVFIGYSLPDDDVEVIYLLKRSLAHLEPGQITVVEYDESSSALNENPVGRRYRTLFGDGIDWHPEGMDDWLPHCKFN